MLLVKKFVATMVAAGLVFLPCTAFSSCSIPGAEQQSYDIGKEIGEEIKEQIGQQVDEAFGSLDDLLSDGEDTELEAPVQEVLTETELKILSRGSEVYLDEFEGVAAYASEQSFDAADGIISYSDVGDFSCAEYVKRFYREKYGIEISLPTGGTPSGLHWVLVPKAGDVMYTTLYGGPHWAIVKHADTSIGKVWVIEQNCLFKSGSDYAVYVNNQYDIISAVFYRK